MLTMIRSLMVRQNRCPTNRFQPIKLNLNSPQSSKNINTKMTRLSSMFKRSSRYQTLRDEKRSSSEVSLSATMSTSSSKKKKRSATAIPSTTRSLSSTHTNCSYGSYGSTSSHYSVDQLDDFSSSMEQDFSGHASFSSLSYSGHGGGDYGLRSMHGDRARPMELVYEDEEPGYNTCSRGRHSSSRRPSSN